MKISEKTLKLVETVKEKERIINGYASNQIENDFNNMLLGKSV